MNLTIRALLIGVLMLTTSGFVVSAVAAEASAPKPGRLWLLYAASSSDHEGRMIGWWGNGWDKFSDVTVPTHVAKFEAMGGLHVYGIQVHHPWGRTVTNGKAIPMEYDQRIKCYRDYNQTGNKKLELALDDTAFLRSMNAISKRHRLMIYTGSPHSMKPLPGESKAAWVQRAKTLLGPTLSVVPPPAIGLDATYGHPYVADPDSSYHFTGGKDGAVAHLIRDLTSHGHEIFFEGGILFNAKWALELCSTYTSQSFWHVVQRKRRCHVPGWGRWARPQAETNGTAMIQLSLKGLSDQEKRDEIWMHLQLGRDVVVPPPKLPGYPWKD